MKPLEAYNSWASQYDPNENKTRDLEARALRELLSAISFDSCLEIGCGTGKNTEWILQKTGSMTAVDLSGEMLSRAREKVQSAKVEFVQADINTDWIFTKNKFDLVGFSLVLEHIKNLGHIFQETQRKLLEGGYVYIGELHPFKQYLGSKARFETGEGVQVVECYNHHISDFCQSAEKHGLRLLQLREWFDNDDQSSVPRILTLLFQKH